MLVSRFSVSLEVELLEALDHYVADNHFPNRSQALRQLIERNLVEKKWQCNHTVAGAITLLYDHHKREVASKIADIQHEALKEIIAVQHIHLSQDLCMEIIAVKGQARELTTLADKLIGLKGIKHGKLVMTQSDSLSENEKAAHHHHHPHS
ncbi:MAG: nickel-responsive transcriptional regulator NikR [Bacteroidales bacterium]|jgi:CopG family nickel-responsive transcriptional regulator|nr:nickel-responsive transcriptional regulator NikR [Bacteroidales bacterium]